MQAFSEVVKDLKFVMYLGAASQMIQLSQGKAILVGGLGINYKNAVVSFRSIHRTEGDLTSPSLKVSPYLSQQKKRAIVLRLGRFGHTAVYCKKEHAVYIFGGQQERDGG